MTVFAITGPRLAIRVDGIVDFTAGVSARPIDWSKYEPLRGLRLTVAALAEVVREHVEWDRWGGRRADLRGADLSGADLRGAYLRGAGLRGADLRGAGLRGADISGADLRGAYLRGADLRGADLRGAGLRGADLRGARLPSPTVVLLAAWGALAPAFTVELMRLDAACHPDPTAFDRWAAGGACPFDGVHVERAAVFHESRDLWSPGPCLRLYDLMVQILTEQCPDWTDEQHAAFEATFPARYVTPTAPTTEPTP